MTQWCLIPNFIFYSVASLLYLSSSFGYSIKFAGRRGGWIPGTAHTLTLLGFFLHLFYLSYTFVYQSRSPFIQHPSDLLVLLSGGIVLLFLWLLWRDRWEGIGSFFIPLAFILLILSLDASPQPHPFVETVSYHPWLLLSHILFAALTLLLMLGSSLLGCVFLIHEQRLKSKKLDSLSQSLPPLLLNEQKAFQWLRFGFISLTLVLITGSFLFQQMATSFPKGIFHIVLALIAWILYAVVLNRRHKGLHGRKILLLSFLGFLSLIGLYLWN